MTTTDADANPVRVVTTKGAVVGTREGADGRRLAVFRGIPYAAPPVGRRRFRPPAELEAWSGDRDATTFGPKSMQPPPDAAGAVPGDPAEQSEDCLYLNVWSPAPALAVPPGTDSTGALLPVMVWIHGGGFVSGTSSSAIYSGEHLAARGVVLVSANYRLGALGWLAHPALADPGDPAGGYGNWGLHDLLAVLGWVRANISSFGGDPELVTVFGESAGAMALASLLAAPAATGLFRRAIMQSGAAAAHSHAGAAAVADELARELGIDELTRAVLQELPAEELVRAQIAIGRRYDGLGLPFQPVVDGGLLAEHPASAIAAGGARDLELVIGSNRDEWRFWTWSNPSLRDIDDERLGRLVYGLIDRAGLAARVDPAETIEVFRRGRESRGASATPPELYTAIASDWTFRVPAMRLGAASGSPNVFAYLFDWESPFAGGALGSCHALDIPFVFGSCDNQFVAVFSGSGDEVDRLTEAMQCAWVAFAATGDPSCGPVGEWPRYDPDRRATMRLGSVIEVLEAPMEPERAWLDGALGPYGVAEAAMSQLNTVPAFRNPRTPDPGGSDRAATGT